MSFTWQAPQRLRSPEQVAAELLKVAREKGLNDFAAVLAVMCVDTESDFWCPANEGDPTSKNYPHDSLSDDGRSVAYFQQQNGVPGENPAVHNWWGPMSSRMDLQKSAGVFYDRLNDDYMDAEHNPVLAAQFIQDVQGSAYEHGENYLPNWDRAHILVAGAAGGQPAGGAGVAWTGDPVWLEDVLRPALGDKLKTLPGWKESGHGDFADIRGVMMHHTGNSRESAQSIRNGRPDLEGPLANLHIAPDGVVTIVAVGVCWHAGRGTYPWLPTNNANQHMIGIECAWPTIKADGSYDPHERWPDAQIISMRDTAAALAVKLGVGSDHVIGHKDYAGVVQGKWDPGFLSTKWFQIEVDKAMKGEFKAPAPKPPVVPPVPLPIDYDRQTWEQARGRWAMLGDQTLVEAVAEIRDHLLGTSDKDKKGARFD